jgi:hypothetical protein
MNIFVVVDPEDNEEEEKQESSDQKEDETYPPFDWVPPWFPPMR